MKKGLALLFLLGSFLATFSQLVTLSPSNAGADDEVVLTFDATQGNGELAGAAKVYIHHGVVTDAPDGTSWQYVIGNWGQDDGVGLMEQVANEPNKWQITLGPSIRSYFGVPEGENIFRISAVFRSADGNTKGTIAAGEYGWGTSASNLDLYINLDADNFITLNAPSGESSFVFPDDSLLIDASASSAVSSMKVWIDEGTGFEEKAAISSGTQIQYAYYPSGSGEVSIRITATINGEDLEIERTLRITQVQPPMVEALPADVQPGINYHTDATRVTLVLEAPGKQFVHVVGDFTDWQAEDAFQMKKTPDGEFFWLEISGLTPMQEYVFQYWVDGNIRVGDPYADKVADPWNDRFIDPGTYPDLPPYDKTEYGIATVLQTGQTPFVWDESETSWERPDLDHIVIYELLVRDFMASHSYADLLDTLGYIKRLGVDAIEIMPFNEFEGNESWGYNPSYYFAPDKYYGTKDELKQFIQAAHQEGLAVIMDMVLNHAYGQNALVQLYFEGGKPAADNPWFNREYVGPFQWGYDFNHESPYTERFIDRINTYWIREYHIDGYRFDFTKGMTNYAPGGNIDGFDQSRIDILKRMADAIWVEDSQAYVILEHWSPAQEEAILADYGMKMWRNRSYDYVPAANGQPAGTFGGMGVSTHVSYFNSHDERRIAEHMLSEGLSSGTYDVKNELIMYERAKMAAAFCFLFPGPKMMWQFDELGYDIHIDFNGRVGNKPLPWGPGSLRYYEDSMRQHIYDAYQGILAVRKWFGPENLAAANQFHSLSGDGRKLVYDLEGTDLVVIGNFGITDHSLVPGFTQTGTWYDYFSGDSIEVENTSSERMNLAPGEWHIYTTTRIGEGMPGVVETFDNPVTISPFPFTQNDEITLTFDATKARSGDTDGLLGAEKVYFHSGVVMDDPQGTDLENIVGTLRDDGVGEMGKVAEDIWEITLTPSQYYNLDADEEPYKIGMFFRDAEDENRGYGFRNGMIFANIESQQPFVSIEPYPFQIDEEITITFNTRKGGQGLAGQDKVYMHSSVDLSDTETPQNSAWDYAIGNWGQDDGVGRMTQVPGSPDLWQISLTPKDYYGLPDDVHAFWLAAVFRSADGSIKGTGTPGQIDNGFIHTNLDFFIQNPFVEDTVVDTPLVPVNDYSVSVFPNPALEQAEIAFEGVEGAVSIEMMDISGRKVYAQTFTDPPAAFSVQLPDSFYVGMYLIRITYKGEEQMLKWIKGE